MTGGTIGGLQTVDALHLFYLLLGVILVTLGVIDLLWTTLWTEGGAGPLTASLMAATWSGIRTVGHGRSRVLSLSGPVILTLTLAVWVLLIWVGWTFVFAGSPNSLNYTRGPEPVRWLGRFYFVGYTMFTLGNGDFSPAVGIWQVVTAVTNASGMVLITLSVTYLINVIQAVVTTNSFASAVHGIGTESQEFVSAGWDGEDFTQHDLPLQRLASELSTIASQHNAYPILHYYRSQNRRRSTPLAIAAFDDALSILRFGVPSEARPGEPLLKVARSSTKEYLRSVYTLPVRPASHPPPAPDLSSLRADSIPVVSDGEFRATIEELEDRRRQIRGIVESQAWTMPQSGRQE